MGFIETLLGLTSRGNKAAVKTEKLEPQGPTISDFKTISPPASGARATGPVAVAPIFPDKPYPYVLDQIHPEIRDYLLDDVLSTFANKGKDYTSGKNTSDPLKQLRETADELGLTVEQVAMTYMAKHYSALQKYAKFDGELESEPVESRIKDLINYLLLFYYAVSEKKKRQRELEEDDDSDTCPCCY